MTAAVTTTDSASGETRAKGNFWHELRRSLIWTMLKRQRWWIAGNLVMGIASTLVLAQVIATVRAIIDDAIIDSVVPIEPLIQRLLAISLIAFFVGFGFRQVGDKIGWTLEYDLRNIVYDRLQRIPPKGLDSLSTGQLMTRTAADLLAMERFIAILPTLLTLAIGLPIFLVIGLSASPLLGLIAFAAFPFDIWLVNRLRRRYWGYNYLAIDQRAKVTTAVDEAIRGIRVVKAFGREEEHRVRVEQAAASQYRYRMSGIRYFAKYDVILAFAPRAIHGIILSLGAWLVISQQSLQVGTLLAVVQVATIVVRSASGLDEAVNSWQETKTSIGRVQELLAWSPPERARRDAAPFPEPSTGFELRDVLVDLDGQSFLGGLDATVRPGQTLVVTGDRGAGKTLLAAVLTGDIRPSEGEVILDGADLATLDAAEIRQAVRVVGEEPFFFNRSVRDNLLLGAMSAAGRGRPTDDHLRDALVAAGADEVLEHLIEGLDTVLSDRGLNLSGGQRQRLGLARAIVVPPRVLVLDDALSAVPPGLEVDILQRLRAFAPAMAVLSMGRREGPEVIADDVVSLPGGVADARDLADDDTPPVGGRSLRDGPYDRRLGPILDDLHLSDDKPIGVDEAKVASSARPTLLSTLGLYPWRLMIGLLVLVGTQVMGLFPATLTGLNADALDDRKLGPAIGFGLAIVFLALTEVVVEALFAIFTRKVDSGITYYLQRRLFHRYTSLGVDYYDRELPGEVSTRFVLDLGTISRFTERSIYLFLQYVVQILVVVGIILFINVQIGLLLFLFVPTVAAITAVYMPFFNRALLRLRNRGGDTLSRIQEDFAGRYVISGFGVSAQARRAFREVNDNYRKARRWSATLGNGYAVFVQLAASLATVIIFLRAGNLAIAGAMTIGTVVTIDRYFDRALDPIPRIATLWQFAMRVRISFGKLADPYGAEVMPPVVGGARQAERLQGDIAFEGVSFAYPHVGRPVLSEISFDVGAGETVAIVGNTGAGKSSVAKLVSRIYDPTQGRVTIDGIDLREFDPASLRHRIAVVPQDAFVFRGTVWSNVAYGKPDASQEDLEAAALAVGAYDTLVAISGGMVEEEGRNLTGAQRQLIALARAWLVGPDILVLDEATSALDDRTEAKVLTAISQLACTKVIITHRRRLAAAADFVVVLDHGRIVQAGTDAELAGVGSYGDLWVAAPAMAGVTATRTRRGRSNGASKAPAASKAARATKALARKRAPAKKATAPPTRRPRRTNGNGRAK